jgi:hybrid cluster-associated redox disulfide protein
MSVAALIVAVVALLVALFALRRMASLEDRLAHTASALDEARGALHETNENLNRKLAELRLGLRRQSGEAIFTPKMTIADAMEVHPQVRDVLASFHLGGCSNCAVSDVDTIEGACQSYGIDEPALMGALNQLVSGGSGGSVGPGVRTSGARATY